MSNKSWQKNDESMSRSQREPGDFMEDPGHDEMIELRACCPECDWEATGNDMHEVAGEYRQHMQDEHNETLTMDVCMERIKDAAHDETIDLTAGEPA